MTDLSYLLSPATIDADLNVPNKKALFQQLAAIGARATGFESKTILAAINEREKLGSTGFGDGTAIPHGRVEGLETIHGAFVRLETPIDFHAVDGMPVDLVFMLLSPPDAGALHLKALAGVSRALRDRTLTAKLRGARSKDAILALLSQVESLHAA